MSEPPTFPLQAHLGFTVEGSDGFATATLELDDRHMNPNGVAHGASATGSFAVLAPHA